MSEFLLEEIQGDRPIRDQLSGLEERFNGKAGLFCTLSAILQRQTVNLLIRNRVSEAIEFLIREEWTEIPADLAEVFVGHVFQLAQLVSQQLEKEPREHFKRVLFFHVYRHLSLLKEPSAFFLGLLRRREGSFLFTVVKSEDLAAFSASLSTADRLFMLKVCFDFYSNGREECGGSFGKLAKSLGKEFCGGKDELQFLLAARHSVLSRGWSNSREIVQAADQGWLFGYCVKEHWKEAGFANPMRCPGSFHELICKILLLLLAGGGFEFEVEIAKGVSNHLKSSVAEYRLIGMIVAEKISKEKIVDGSAFPSELTEKWRVARDEASSNGSMVSTITEGQLLEDLRSLKIRIPAFIGDFLEIFKDGGKRSASLIEFLLQELPTAISGASNTEIQQYSSQLVRNLIFLRNEFELDQFLHLRCKCLHSLIRKNCSESVHEICTEIHSNRLSIGDRLELLSVLAMLLNSTNEPAVGVVEPSSLANSKIRFISFKRLQQLRDAVPASDDFLSRLLPSVFFSLIRPTGERVEAVANQVLLTASQFLIALQCHPDVARACEEFLEKIEPFRLERAKDLSAASMVLCCYYALVTAVPLNVMRNSERWVLFADRACDEIDWFLTAYSSDKSFSDASAISVSALKILSEKLSSFHSETKCT